MRLVVVVLATFLGAFATNLSESREHAATQSQPQLDTRIPAPDRARYRAIQNEREWRNPYLLVSNQGFELRSLSEAKPRIVRLPNLRRVLTELPLSDWPYGRVVVVQSPSIVPGDEEWIAAMRHNIAEARKVLEALGADEWGWPA